MMVKKRQVVRVSRLLPSFLGPVFDVPSLDILQQNCAKLYDADDVSYGVSEGSVLMFRKKNFKPNIRRVEKILCNPELNQVHLSREELDELSTDYGFEVLQTPTCSVVITDRIVFISEKDGRDDILTSNEVL